MRRITRGLGDARDKDVQIEFLCGVLGAMSERELRAGHRAAAGPAGTRAGIAPAPRAGGSWPGWRASRALEKLQAAAKKVLASPGAETVRYGDFARRQTSRCHPRAAGGTARWTRIASTIRRTTAAAPRHADRRQAAPLYAGNRQAGL